MVVAGINRIESKGNSATKHEPLYGTALQMADGGKLTTNRKINQISSLYGILYTLRR